MSSDKFSLSFNMFSYTTPINDVGCLKSTLFIPTTLVRNLSMFLISHVNEGQSRPDTITEPLAGQ